MTDQELNEAVARKLHGDEWMMWSAEDYCHSIEAAWEIVEWLNSRGKEVSLSSDKTHLRKVWDCRISWRYEGDDIEESADTAPMAIVKAFLKLETK